MRTEIAKKAMIEAKANSAAFANIAPEFANLAVEATRAAKKVIESSNRTEIRGSRRLGRTVSLLEGGILIFFPNQHRGFAA